MNSLVHQFLCDEAGFVVSAELMLVATVVTLSLVVGLSEVSANINQELEDIGSAFGSLNQSYSHGGSRYGDKPGRGHGRGKGRGHGDSDIHGMPAQGEGW